TASEGNEVRRSSDDNIASSSDASKSIHRSSAELDAGDQFDANPRALPTRDISDRDPIRSMDEQSLSAQANSSLASVEALDAFQEKVVTHIETWASQDNSQIEAREVAKRTFYSHRHHLMQDIHEECGPGALNDFNKADKMREQLKDRPALLADYENFLLARDAYAHATKQPRDSIVDRKRELENDVNDFLRSQGLPAVTISAARDLGNDVGEYLSGQGVILIRGADLRGAASRDELAASVM